MQFQWRDNEFIIRDKKWVDLMKYNDTKPYFCDECLHASKAKNSRAMVFKTAQFSIFVVMLEKQWEEFQVFKEKCEWKHESNILVPVPPAQVRQVHSDAIAPTPFATMSSITSSHIDMSSSHQSAPLSPTPSSSTPLSYPAYDVPSASSRPIQSSGSTSRAVVSASDPPLSLTSAKRHHQHSRSTSDSSTQSPPPKRTLKATFASLSSF